MKQFYTEQELNDLIEEYKPLVGSVIRKKRYYLLDDYADVFQVGLIGLWKGLISFDNERHTKLSSFLFITINSNIIDTYKDRKKSNATKNATISYDAVFEGDDQDTDTKMAAFHNYSSTPEDVGRHMIYQKVLDDISKEKDPVLREMVWSYYVDQMGYQEIANKLGCTKQNVLTRIDRFIKSYSKTLFSSGYIQHGDLNIV